MAAVTLHHFSGLAAPFVRSTRTVSGDVFNFYRTYENDQTLLRLAMKIGWTQNVVIMEVELTREARKWYLEQARAQQWSKVVLLEKLASAAHLEKSLDESKRVWYTKENDECSEKIQHEEDPVYLPRQYPKKP